MATRMLLHLCDATNKCVLSSVQFHRTKFQVQSVIKHSRNFRRVRTVREESKTPFANIEVQYAGPSNSKKLWRAFVFATTFSGASFLGAAILEYERIRAQTFKGFNKQFFRPAKTTISEWRSEIRNWWTNLKEGQRIFYFILFANTLVFLAWRIPQIKPVMLKYFASNPASNVIVLPMLLSTFSHYNLWHLAANMYVLHSFSIAADSYLGREQFVALYLSSGVVSSFFSLAYKILLNRQKYSLGASGAIMGILSFICIQFPNTEVSIIFLPQFAFSAGAAIKSIIALDTAGCLMGWRFFDHAAHLGGAFFAIFWQYWGLENIWQKRSPLIKCWHEFRNPPK